MTTPDPRPALHIVRGDPTDTELVALVTALSAVAPGAAPPPPRRAPRSRWSDRTAMMRTPLPHGPNAWHS